MKWLFFQSVLENKNNSRMDVTVLITGGCGEGFRGYPSPTGDPPQPSLFREGANIAET